MKLDPSIIFQIPVLLLALSFHEMAHAWMANRLGDPTGRMLGRLTMDPRPHIDPIGTILFPLLLLAFGSPAFGWAKPVPFTSQNLRQPARDSALIYAAGPTSNLVLALAGTVLYRLVALAGPVEGSLLAAASTVCFYLVGINLLLFFFNLIPIPPLDGGGMFLNLAPRSMAPITDFLQQFGPILFILLIFSGWFRFFLTPVEHLQILLLGLR